MLKWFWTACAAACVLFLSGCATSGGNPNDPAAIRSSPVASERKQALLSKGSLSGPEWLELAELHTADRSFIAAESAYWGALTRGLDAGGNWRARMGLGRCDDARLQWASAALHYGEAASMLVPLSDRDAARAAQALSEFRGGQIERARKTRGLIAMTSAPQVADLDRLLGGKVAAPSPRVETPVGTSARGLAARPRGTGARSAPKIVSRIEWRATPTILKRTEPMGAPTRLTLHHTADLKPVGTSFADVAERMRAYQNGHNGAGHFWADIGYHFVVDKQGRIWEGRPLVYQGAHGGSDAANSQNIGIALIGNFSNGVPSAAQVRATTDLVGWLCSEYRIPSAKVYGHEDIKKMYRLKGTACPGAKFDPTLRQIRASVSR